MADNALNGNDELWSFKEDGDSTLLVAVCQTGGDFEIDNAIVKTKTKCGTVTTLGTQDFNGSLEGQCIYDPSSGKAGMALLYDWALNKTLLNFSKGKASPVTGDITVAGNCYIGNLKQSDPTDENCSFSCTLAIQGTPTIVETT